MMITSINCDDPTIEWLFREEEQSASRKALERVGNHFTRLYNDYNDYNDQTLALALYHLPGYI